MRYTATYSPEDNKLRLYASSRLDAETYARIKAAGFRWAPKQDLFFAPAWSPGREDLLIELAGEIGDEDTDMQTRAEQRAERFEEYSDKRSKEANRARESADAIAERFWGGQPILVGHHSEKRARKDQERIHDNMRKAIKLWDTSAYWTDRAASAIAHAKYKELPRVRARRIKTIEADLRKEQRHKADAERRLAFWMQDGISHDQAKQFANYNGFYMPRKDTDRPDFNQQPSAWDCLSNSYPNLYGPRTLDEIIAAARRLYPRTIARADRWIRHYENRLAYEKAMLADQGASALIAPKPRPTQLPLLNYRAEGGKLEAPSRYERGRIQTYEQVDMSKADFAKIGSDYKGTLTIDGTHRIRSAIVRKPGEGHGSLRAIFITDSKAHPIPDKAAPQAAQEPRQRPIEIKAPMPRRPAPKPEAAEFEALRQQLKAGVKIVIAPQLFPTPPAIAEQMIDAAAIEPGQRILEPSAGTGNLVKALPNIRPHGTLTAIEINTELARHLEASADRVIAGDFLEQRPEDLGPFDRIIMNPPFERGADIRHIRHAIGFLKPGGRLVALCAAGPRQEAELKPIAEGSGGFWERLPAGSFSSQGTGVNVAMLGIMAPPAIKAERTEQLALWG
jgi:phospholipid N-methyltransferase